ncbi:MAG: ABC transporter permease [Bacteroidetes bacterium 4572_128]|nr:MAG: ABC transporter permease [Bacteroidetes bacterium 4572_128]
MKFKIIVSSFAFFILFLYLSLIISAFLYFDIDNFTSDIFSERTFFSIKLSVITASISTLLSIIISIPAAYALSRYNFFGKNLIDLFLELPLILSPAALGATLLIFFSNSVGIWLQENITQIIFTFWAVIIAQFVSILGISTRMVKSIMDEIPKRYEDIARTLGATPMQAFFTISLPLSKKGLLSVFIMTWAKAFGEFGATFTIAGTMAMKTETIPVSIFMKLSNADVNGSIAMIMVLVSTGISLLFITKLIKS